MKNTTRIFMAVLSLSVGLIAQDFDSIKKSFEVSAQAEDIANQKNAQEMQNLGKVGIAAGKVLVHKVVQKATQLREAFVEIPAVNYVITTVSDTVEDFRKDVEAELNKSTTSAVSSDTPEQSFVAKKWNKAQDAMNKTAMTFSDYATKNPVITSSIAAGVVATIAAVTYYMYAHYHVDKDNAMEKN